MDLDLERLIKQKENSKLDFKRQWYWNTNITSNKQEELWGECIKDILALTNGNPNNINEMAYLVIGIDDESKNACNFDFPQNKQNKILSESKLQQTLLSKLNTYSQPEFTGLNVEYRDFNNQKIILISIPPRERLLSLSKDLKFKNRTDRKGTTYYRIGEEIRIVSADIHDDFSRARGNKYELIDIIEKLGGEEDFLKKYFGDDYEIVLKNPQTYTNLKYKLLTVNNTLDSILQEKVELKNKIQSQQFDDDIQNKVEKAMCELRFDDAIAILSTYLTSIANTKEGMYQAHYIKAIAYMQNVQYPEAKEEIEFIPYLKVDDIGLLNDYAEIYRVVGNYPKSIEILEYYKKALTIYKVTFGTDEHSIVATTYGNMALVYQELGNTIQSYNYHKKALDIRNKVLQQNDYSIGLSHANLTGFFNTLKNFPQAYLHVCKVVDIWEDCLGEKHPDFIKALETKIMLGRII